MLKLKLQYFGYLMQRTDSWKRPQCWKRLKAGEKQMTENEIESITDSMEKGLSKLWKLVMDRGA